MKKRFMPCVMAVLLACLLLLPGTAVLAEDSAEPGQGDTAAGVTAGAGAMVDILMIALAVAVSSFFARLVFRTGR